MWLSTTHVNAERAEEDKGQFWGWLEVFTHSRPTFPGARNLRLQLKGCWRRFVFSGPRTDLLSVPDAGAPLPCPSWGPARPSGLRQALPVHRRQPCCPQGKVNSWDKAILPQEETRSEEGDCGPRPK